MELAEKLIPAHVTLLRGADKTAVIDELLDVLYDSGVLADRATARHDVLAREQYLSTGMEEGLAVPHAKTDAVSELVVAFGLHRDGIDFESMDGKPARFIFLVLSPRSTSGPHIRALAQITRALKDASVRQALLEADTAENIASIIIRGSGA
ncbi:MAG: PTS sugar transporter subunit IIA [Calditrichaeota bacterium]|nr:MAG: PTS sugar transporter subunit IIA [Calditrichota bacterium]